MGYYYWDPTYILVVIGAVICMIASARVKGTFNKYSQLRSMSGMNGAQVAQRVLQAAGIYEPMSVDTLYSMQKAMHLFQSGVHLCL